MPFPGGAAYFDPDGILLGIFHIHVGMAGYGVYEFNWFSDYHFWRDNSDGPHRSAGGYWKDSYMCGIFYREGACANSSGSTILGSPLTKNNSIFFELS